MKARSRPVPFHRSSSAVTLSIIQYPAHDRRDTVSMPNLFRPRDPDTPKDRPSTTMTFNTLSMISTPWTDSLCSIQSLESDTTGTTYLYKSLSSSTYTVHPRSTTSSGAGSSNLDSKTTINLTSATPGLDISTSPTQSPKARSRTLSSWTLETLTSSELLPIRPGTVKAKYPWSPSSSLSCSDCYPSSLTTLASKGRPISPEVSSSVLVLPHGLKFIGPNNDFRTHHVNFALIEERFPYVNIVNTTV